MDWNPIFKENEHSLWSHLLASKFPRSILNFFWWNVEKLSTQDKPIYVMGDFWKPVTFLNARLQSTVGEREEWEKIVSVVVYESIVCLIILLGCLSFSSSSTAKMDSLLLQCDPRTDLISLKKHLDQGFGEEKQSSETGRKEDGQIWKEGKPTKKGSRLNAFNSRAKSVKTDQWTNTTVKAPVFD